MNRKLYYCKSWFRSKKRPTEIWTEAQARAAYNENKPFTVLVDSQEKPSCFIEVAAKSIGVCFLDNLQRQDLSYSFQEIETGKLFLSMATYQEFVGDSEKPELSEVFVFKPDGKVTTLRQSGNPAKVQKAENITDVSTNYENKPAFGEYAAVIRRDR